MKVKIIQSFVDKDTKKIMDPGKEAEYEEERAKFLIKEGLCEAAKAKKKVK